jgi:dTMP kinase
VTAPGRFITFEGVDGAGKSTQLRRLAASLRAEGATVVETREPGGSAGAEAIRALLVNGETGRWSPETELLLFTAARRDHLERTISPALARGDSVLCDRFVDSTRAYQSAGRGGDRDLVDWLHTRLIGRDPDLTIVLDIDPAVSLARSRAAGGASRFEDFGLPFQIALRAAFRDIAAAEPARCVLIDADAAPDAVAARISEACAARCASPA